MAKSPTATDIDADAVRKLAELLEETGLTEIEYTHDGWSLRVSKGATAVAAQVPGTAHGSQDRAPSQVLVVVSPPEGDTKPTTVGCRPLGT